MIGKRLKYLRKSNKLEREELANKLGLSYSAIAMYERNEREPSNEILTNIARIFGVTTDFLLENTEAIENQEVVSPQNDRLDEYENIKKINGIAADDGNNEVNDDLLRDVNNYIGFRLKQIEEEKKKKE